jgi:hypothetical protein
MKQMLAAASTTMKHFTVAIDLWHYNHMCHMISISTISELTQQQQQQ